MEVSSGIMAALSSLQGAVATARASRHVPLMNDSGQPSIDPPLKAAIIPVTAFQQNCSLIWCTKTMKGAFVDAGGDLDRLKAAAAQHGVTIEKLLVTHGHIDHCGGTGKLAAELGVPIEGPHRDDIFWIERLGQDGLSFAFPVHRSSPIAGWTKAIR